MLRPGSLVLYKSQPARVRRAGDKLEIDLGGGRSRKVRPKDVVLLHPGPVQSLDELRLQEGEVKIAWQLLSGGKTSLAELAELVYGAYTPATAWASWQLVADGLYFRGRPEEVRACSPEQVAREHAARKTRAASRRAWAAFLERARAGQVTPADGHYLREVELVAMGRNTKSRVLRELGRTESPENAHATLLELGHWDHAIVPYPQRLGLATSTPAVELPDFPEETRADLAHLAAFAIDDEGNQDPDDAISLEEGRLWVHVADVAALVRPDSEADLEARARGASLYLPEGTVPMLPLQAVQVLGLGLAEASSALSVGLELDSEGEITNIEVTPSRVRVKRLTYEQAEDRLGEEPLQELHRLAQIRNTYRHERGAISIQLPEVKIGLVDGEVVIHPLPPLRSKRLVLEAMLMAGEAAARFAIEQAIPFPFTSQSAPITRDSPEGLAGMYALRRTLRPSSYTTVPAPHAGLGLEVYAQVTSPLRRYLDLVAHQQLRAFFCGERLLEAQGVLERVGSAAAVGGDVRRAERLARRHWTLVYLTQHPDWRGEGILVEKHDQHGRVLIPELDLDVQLHLRENLPLNSSLSLALIGVNLAELLAHFRVER